MCLIRWSFFLSYIYIYIAYKSSRTIYQSSEIINRNDGVRSKNSKAHHLPSTLRWLVWEHKNTADHDEHLNKVSYITIHAQVLFHFFIYYFSLIFLCCLINKSEQYIYYLTILMILYQVTFQCSESSNHKGNERMQSCKQKKCSKRPEFWIKHNSCFLYYYM